MEAAWIARPCLGIWAFVDYRKPNHIFTRGKPFTRSFLCLLGFNSFCIFCLCLRNVLGTRIEQSHEWTMSYRPTRCPESYSSRILRRLTLSSLPQTAHGKHPPILSFKPSSGTQIPSSILGGRKRLILK
jgi:hypothetical protein